MGVTPISLLTGIDTSNILEESGRGSRRAAARGVNYAAQFAVAKDSDEEDEEDEEEEDEESDEASVGAVSDDDDDDGAGDEVKVSRDILIRPK
jgi:ribosomal protein L12E/L44/L45/RPP1/RPP2